jgi:ubiquinone/menaquinone biosynthesis C-methylase UbiE
MLEQARGKRQDKVGFGLMDGQTLAFPNACFDGVLLNLILSVVPDGKRALEEAWRVLRPGGRMVVFDKFLPEHEHSTAFRNLLGSLIRQLGTDPNRRFSDMVMDLPLKVITKDEPALLRGQYRIILLNKPFQT